jgi:ubiquinone/menaquinone biosynthesis C-methylase UbiE
MVRRFAVALALCAGLWGQVAGNANANYRTHEGRQAVGRGLGAIDRDDRQKPKELIAAMELQPGMTVADIGTGVGYMLPFLSQAVGPSGKVLAEDIFDDFLDQAKTRGAKEQLTNVTFIKGTERDPSLPDNSVDVALALDSYHHYDYPGEMLAGIHRGLRDGGRLVVVEYYKNKTAMPGGNALQHIRLDKPDVAKEIEANHFKLLSEREHIKDVQYMLVFAKN